MSTDIPVSILLGNSVSLRSEIILATLNRIAELEKLIKDLTDELIDEKGVLRCAELLEAKRDAIIKALLEDARQMRLDFTTRRVVEARARTRTAA